MKEENLNKDESNIELSGKSTTKKQEFAIDDILSKLLTSRK